MRAVRKQFTGDEVEPNNVIHWSGVSEFANLQMIMDMGDTILPCANHQLEVTNIIRYNWVRAFKKTNKWLTEGG